MNQSEYISPGYVELQKKLHAQGNYGVSAGRWANAPVRQIAQVYGCRDILDYGCGAGQLKAVLGPIVREYDPCIAGKDSDPEPADMVACIDVLEHIEPDRLPAVLRHIRSKARKVAFFIISQRPANKTLADGRNAHLIIETAEWWKDALAEHFAITDWIVDKGIAAVAVPLSGDRAAPRRLKNSSSCYHFATQLSRKRPEAVGV